MDIHELIRAAYPDADPLRDYTAQDDGYGAYISVWNIAGPVPEGVTMGETALQVFQRLHGTLRDDAQTLIQKADVIQNLLDANPQVAAQAASAEPGAIVGNTGMVREEVLMGIALIASFRAYADSVIVPASETTPAITIRDAVYRLG